MRILITYASRTGNTQNLAERFAKELKDNHQVDICNINSVKSYDLNDYDLYIIGSWIHRSTVIKYVEKFIYKLKDKKMILFGTLAADPCSEAGEKTYYNIKSLVEKSNNFLLQIILLRGLADKSVGKTIRRIPSFIVGKELKQKMIQAMNESRNPSEEEYELAIESLRDAMKNIIGA